MAKKRTAGLVDVRNRGVRGGTQLTAAGLILQGIEEFNLAHPTPGQTKWLMAALGVLISLAQNYAENRGWIGAFLKNVPEEPLAAEEPPR